MALLPPSTVTFKCSPGPDGYTFSEDWSSYADGTSPLGAMWETLNTNHQRVWFDMVEDNYSDVLPTNPYAGVPGGVFADDGQMGGRWCRLLGRCAMFPRPFFDLQTFARWSFRVRVIYPSMWTGVNVLYGGENSYCAGITCENVVYADPYDRESPAVGVNFGMYLVQSVVTTPTNTVGETYLPFGQVRDVEMEWIPGRSGIRKVRARSCVVVNGVSSGEWTPWVEIVSRVYTPYPTNETIASWPAGMDSGSFYMNASMVFPATSYLLPNGAGIVDYGQFKYHSDNPLWGASDFIGWDTWRRSSTCIPVEGQESSGVLGGLTGRPSHYPYGGVSVWGTVPDYLAPVVHPYTTYPEYALGEPVSQDFDAQSPAVVPETGYRYKTLRFRAYHANDQYGMINPRFPEGSLRLQVCDAATGEPLPDSMVPGNSVGLCSVSPTVPMGVEYKDSALNFSTDDVACVRSDPPTHEFSANPPGTQIVSLANVPTDVTIYLDVQGRVDASVGMPNVYNAVDFVEAQAWDRQPRLGGVWIDFEQVRLTVRHGPISNGATLLSGTRALGSSVTVTGNATIGAVSYPSDSTWEASVSGLASSTTFSITDGTDTLLDTITIPLVLEVPSVSMGVTGVVPQLSCGFLVPTASLSLQSSIPSLGVVQSVVRLSPPAAETLLSGVPPALEVRAASRWAPLGGKFRLADGREITVRVLT